MNKILNACCLLVVLVGSVTNSDASVSPPPFIETIDAKHPEKKFDEGKCKWQDCIDHAANLLFCTDCTKLKKEFIKWGVANLDEVSNFKQIPDGYFKIVLGVAAELGKQAPIREQVDGGGYYTAIDDIMEITTPSSSSSSSSSQQAAAPTGTPEGEVPEPEKRRRMLLGAYHITAGEVLRCSVSAGESIYNCFFNVGDASVSEAVCLCKNLRDYLTRISEKKMAPGNAEMNQAALYPFVLCKALCFKDGEKPFSSRCKLFKQKEQALESVIGGIEQRYEPKTIQFEKDCLSYLRGEVEGTSQSGMFRNIITALEKVDPVFCNLLLSKYFKK